MGNRKAIAGIAAVLLIIPLAVSAADAQYYTDCHGVYGFNRIVCDLHVRIHELTREIQDRDREIRDLRQQLSEAGEKNTGYLGGDDWINIPAGGLPDPYGQNRVLVTLERNKYDPAAFRILFNDCYGVGKCIRGNAANVVYHAEIWRGDNLKDGVHGKRSEGVSYVQFRGSGTYDDLRVCVSEVAGKAIKQGRNTDPIAGVHGECTSFGKQKLEYNTGRWR